MDYVPLECDGPTDWVPPCSNFTTAPSMLATTANYKPEPSFVDANPTPGGDRSLGALHVATDRFYTGSQAWAIAFQAAPAIAAPVEYTLFVDIDHVAGQGGAQHPVSGAALPVNTLFLPEYVVIIPRTGDAVSPTAVRIYEWNGAAQPPRWNAARTLGSILGLSWFDPETDAVQLVIPYGAIGAGRTDFSGSMALFLLASNSSGVGDTVPPQSGVPYARPAMVSDAIMPLYPFDMPLSNPRTFYDMPTLRWRVPYFDSIDGYQVQVARDNRFTDLVETRPWETFESKIHPFFQLLPAAMQPLAAYSNNETYYWRVRIRHERFVENKPDFYDYGPWSSPMRFKLDSRDVGSPHLSTGVAAYMTPTFLWERVEGAAGYVLQVDIDPGFNDPVVNIATDATSYTPTEAQGGRIEHSKQYFWRVAIRRDDDVLGDWTTPLTFTKSSVVPALVQPAETATITGQPTFEWSPILTPAADPRLAAPRYRIVVKDGGGAIALNEVTQATMYTPPIGKALPQGTWYWQVALVDANNKDGPFSAPRAFTIAYTLPAPVGSPQGAKTGLPPTLAWTPIPGAAYYKVEYSTNETFASSTSVKTNNSSFTPTAALKAGIYFWRVQMFDADDNPGPLITNQFLFGATAYLPIANR
jgi:hypothetical protein